MRVYHRPIDRYTHATGWVYIDPDAAPSVITRLAGGGATIETLTGVRYATGLWFITTTDALYIGGGDYEMVWTVTIAGSVGDAPPEMFRHVTPSTADVTPPGPPGVSDPAVGDTWATFTVTPPSDADYATTVITVVDKNGNAYSAPGASGSVTVTGLAASSTYHWSAESVDTSGNRSLVAGNPIGSLTTRPSLTVAKPLLLKYFVNNEGTQHEYGPRELDVEHEQGGFTEGDDRAPLGVGDAIRLRYEGNFAIPHAFMDLVLRYLEPQDPPFGLHQKWRSR